MERVSDNEKANKLANAVANEVASGWRVESQTSVQAILVKGKEINHILQIILSVITLGFWLLVYVPLWAINRRRTKIVRVDDFGNVLIQD